MTRTPLAKENDTQRLILDYLAAKKIWHIRLNTGAMGGSYKGKSWYVRFGKPGMADVLVWQTKHIRDCGYCEGLKIPYTTHTCPTSWHEEYLVHNAIWVEIKSSKGRQSPEQKAFQTEVEFQGMKYVLARSLDDVTAVLT